MYTHMNFTGKGFIGKTEIKQSNDSKRATLRIGVTDTWKNDDGEKQERTDWFTITTFRKTLIEMVEQGWIAKGRYVEINGELRDNRWTDNDGKEHFEVQLIASDIQFLDRKPANA